MHRQQKGLTILSGLACEHGDLVGYFRLVVHGLGVLHHQDPGDLTVVFVPGEPSLTREAVMFPFGGDVHLQLFDEPTFVWSDAVVANLRRRKIDDKIDGTLNYSSEKLGTKSRQCDKRESISIDVAAFSHLHLSHDTKSSISSALWCRGFYQHSGICYESCGFGNLVRIDQSVLMSANIP